MDRLTERDEYGNADIIGVDSGDLQLNLDFDEFNRVTDALNKLASYEDTGLTPEEVKEMMTDGTRIFASRFRNMVFETAAIAFDESATGSSIPEKLPRRR